jgi:pimeloyl-ACP methyl ester carboxylesterase
MDAALIAELAPRFIQIDSTAGPGQAAVLDAGPQDRPVDIVFLHANGFNASTYRTVLSPLADTLRVVAVDQRGHGLSRLAADPVDSRRSWKDLRDDLIALLEALGGPAPVVAGHSMGGTVSILAAAARPDLVRSLMLFDPVVLPKSMRPMTWLPILAARRFRASPMAVGALRRRADFPDRAAVLAAYRGRGAFKTWPDAVLADYVATGFRDTPEGVTLSCAPA